jgi:hypothetical protein
LEKFEEKIKEEYGKRQIKLKKRGLTSFVRQVQTELFADDEIIKCLKLRMFHAHPFDSFSCISFKESPLGAEHAFLIQRASFFNKIESDKNASRAEF